MLKKILKWSVVVTILSFIGVFVYVHFATYDATQEAETAIHLEYVEKTDKVLIFQAEQAIANLVFYPGGFVDHVAYAVLSSLLAEENINVFLVNMPLGLAILDEDAIEDVMKKYPSDLPWYIGGHSLGGASASLWSVEHQDVIDGIFFLGSYPANSADLSSSSLSVLSIYGEFDEILNIETYIDTQKLLPLDTTYHIIQGGNHSYFGYYGLQKNDHLGTISREEQHHQTVVLIINWINSMAE